MSNRRTSILSNRYNRPTAEGVARALAPFGIDCSPEIAAHVLQYMDLLIQWNQKFNLTSLRDPEQVLTRHFGESFFAASSLDMSKGRLADVGSGAGFPGLALKLLRPHLEVALIEANAKKAAFLSEVIRKLGVQDVEVLRARLDATNLRAGSLDFITARAVGHLDELLKWSHRVLRPGGRIVLWLGKEAIEELLHYPQWEWQEPIPIPLSERRFLLIGKPAPDPSKQAGAATSS